MNISVRAFASYREAIGQSQIRLDIAPGSTAVQVWLALRTRYPRLDALPTPFAYAVNDEYVPPETVLRDRDEIVLVPPVSGGTDDGRTPEPAVTTGGAPQPGAAAGQAGAGAATSQAGADVALVDEAISVDPLLARVRHPRAGAVVLFLGTVRENREGQRVRHLEYEAYGRMALREMQQVCTEAAARWPLLRIAMVHRLGRLAVGEVSVAIAVSSAHRGDAFEAGKFAIDTLKQRVPIWKKEVWEGGEAWVGSEPDRRSGPRTGS